MSPTLFIVAALLLVTTSNGLMPQLTPNSLDIKDHTLETWLQASKLVDAAPDLKTMFDWKKSHHVNNGLASLTAVKKSDSTKSAESSLTSYEFVHEDMRDALHTLTKVAGSHTVATDGLIAPTTFTCVSLPTTYDPFTLCSGVVDYPFMMPFNSTLTTMDAAARAATSSGLAFLNSLCLTDLKRMICATVYRPCVTNGNCNLFLLFYFIFLNLYLYIIFILD